MTNGEAGMKDWVDKAGRERLEKDVLAVKNDLSALTKQVTDALNTFLDSAGKQTRHGYKQARENVGSTLDAVSEHSGAMIGAAQEAATSIEETLEDTIRQRPIGTVALALGIGFLLGLAWRR